MFELKLLYYLVKNDLKYALHDPEYLNAIT